MKLRTNAERILDVKVEHTDRKTRNHGTWWSYWDCRMHQRSLREKIAEATQLNKLRSATFWKAVSMGVDLLQWSSAV